MSNLSNSNILKKGGYESLLVYQQAVIIFDLNLVFLKNFLSDSRFRRTVEQTCPPITLHEPCTNSTGKASGKFRRVEQASLEDYRDFIRSRNLALWDKNDPKVLEIRAIRITNLSNLSNWSNWTNNPESFANLMITLTSRENYLLDQLIRSLEEKFVSEGGYSENLFKKRIDFRAKNPNLSNLSN